MRNKRICFIVLCLILDSRQNGEHYFTRFPAIVLCLILDSRQNPPFYIPKPHSDCTVPYFGFNAKHDLETLAGYRYCTVPYFGFKAKHDLKALAGYRYCTVPYFGFKAKLTITGGRSPSIVLCLILDSRQNHRDGSNYRSFIVLCLVDFCHIKKNTCKRQNVSSATRFFIPRVSQR